MLKRYRPRDVVLAVAGSVVFLGLCYALFDLVYRQYDGGTYTQRYAAEDQAQTQREIASKCSPLPRDEFVICVGSEFAAEREAYRSHQDLEAQQQSARAAFWMFVIGGAQALLGVGGIYFVARTLDKTAEASKAAGDQVSLSRIALENTERALITMREVEAIPTIDAETDKVIAWRFRTIWKNAGRTRSRRATSNVNFGYTDGNLPTGYPDDGQTSALLLAPEVTRIGASIAISIDDMLLIKEGQKHAFVWGWCDYDDVFQETPRHRTEFCFEIIPLTTPTHEKTGFTYAHTGPFNAFDDECVQKPKPYQNA